MQEVQLLNKPENSTIYFEDWDIYLGDHTQSGNRQHYLLGIKEKKAYIDTGFLSKTFNPKEFMIMSTDFNRTIMSAYSEILAFYPFYSAKNLTEQESEAAVTPFEFDGQDAVIKELGLSPTKYGFQPIPIQVGDIDEMMRGMDSEIWPYQSTLRKMFASTDNWQILNNKYQSVLFSEMINKWNSDRNLLNFSTAYPIVDNYYSAWFDQMESVTLVSDEAQKQINEISNCDFMIEFNIFVIDTK